MGGGQETEKKKSMHDYFLSRAKTSGLLTWTEMTLNIFEEDVPRPIQQKTTKKSKGASTTVINAPFKNKNKIRATAEEKVYTHKETG